MRNGRNIELKPFSKFRTGSTTRDISQFPKSQSGEAVTPFARYLRNLFGPKNPCPSASATSRLASYSEERRDWSRISTGTSRARARCSLWPLCRHRIIGSRHHTHDFTSLAVLIMSFTEFIMLLSLMLDGPIDTPS